MRWQNEFKVLTISITLLSLSFAIGFGTLCSILKYKQYEIGINLEEENENDVKTEKEKEKEKETDDLDEVFFENLILSFSQKVLVLNYDYAFHEIDFILHKGISDISPPPPKC